MGRILIIDDDPHCREMLRARLKKERHEVLEASDGEEGLRTATRLHPHLIILDIRIPKIDGWELCRQLKNNPETMAIPVIMLTGCSQDIQEKYGRQCGADEYIVKPWEWPALLAALRKLLTFRRSVDTLHSEPVKERMKRLVQTVVQVTAKLPTNETATLMANQLSRFATSAMADYQDSGNGASQPDFVVKMKRVSGKLNDLAYWLNLLQASAILPHPDLKDLITETQSLAGLMESPDSRAA